MTSSTRTSDDIERDIVDERNHMSDRINDLQKKFSADAIVTDLGAMVRGQGSDIARVISDVVSRNPAAVVLVGVGLAWLFLGQGSKVSHGTPARPSDHSHGGGTDRSAHDNRDDAALRKDDQYWYRDGHRSADSQHQERGTKGWGKGTSAAGEGSQDLSGSIQKAASSVGHAVSDAAGALSRTASDLTERLSDGLGDLSEEAKARVMSARRAAHEARLSSTEVMKRGSRTASGIFEDQPLVVGALAVALGAAIGGALPRSKIENDTMGDSSDHLFAEAQALFREERDKAKAAAKMAASDVKDEIKDMGSDLAELLPDGKTVGGVIVDRASDAATRVFNHAAENVGHEKPDQSRS